MKKNKLRQISIVNLIAGYTCLIALILLVALNRHTPEANEARVIVDEGGLFDGEHPEEKIVYVDRPVISTTPTIIDRGVGVDRLDGVILDDGRDVVVIDDTPHVAVVGNNDRVLFDDTDIVGNRVLFDDTDIDVVGNRRAVVDRIGDRVVRDHVVRDHVRDDRLIDRDVGSVDLDAYERAIREDSILDRRLRELDEDVGVDKEGEDINLAGLTLARDDDDLGDIDLNFDADGKDYGIGKGGQLYAYDFPSRGVGAGIGNGSIGAGAGGSAGIGAGIGEGLLNGDTVPTLGGVGTYSVPGDGTPGSEGPVTKGGVGGLVGGAGAGGAAGLMTGMVKTSLGAGPGTGIGVGSGGGGYGRGHREYEYDLPPDGALHIMIHVDGSGSLLSTRIKLDEMKETLLKDALLPYYNNDESLYDKRVTIIDSSGERSLQFFAEATKKDNVLALAFQDEAAPDYHLPNFNKKPQQAYSSDLGKLKSGLNGYNGVYRGVMFQVDRGRTFSKSFKELIECAWNGEGYLATENLKKYHRDNNNHHIRNKNGIVFSDEYHAKSEADPQYYLDLIFKASKRIGLDLQAKGAGLTDGKYNDRE